MVDGVALALLAGLTLLLAARRTLEGPVLMAAVFILPGVGALRGWALGGLSDLGLAHAGIGGVTLGLAAGALIAETGRHLLLGLSLRRDASALTAGYAWAAWDLAAALIARLHAGGQPLDALVDLLVARTLPSLVQVGLSFVHLWSVRAPDGGRRALLFCAAWIAHIAAQVLLARHAAF